MKFDVYAKQRNDMTLISSSPKTLKPSHTRGTDLWILQAHGY